MFEKYFQAYRLGHAAHLAMQGDVGRAQKVIERIKTPVRNKAVVEALRAYLHIANGQKNEASIAISLSRKYNTSISSNSQYIATYCDYLTAMIDNDVKTFNYLSLQLKNADEEIPAKAFLVVDNPMPHDSSTSVNNNNIK